MQRPTNQATLCLPYRESEILLGMKKRGFGVGKYNGFGGKPGAGETIEEAALRELEEESGLCAKLQDLQKIAELDFYFPHKPDWNQTVHVYFVSSYSGEPQETEEMSVHWFNREKIPYQQMWDDDKYWLPLVLEGKKLQATITFNKDNLVDYKEIKEVETFRN